MQGPNMLLQVTTGPTSGSTSAVQPAKQAVLCCHSTTLPSLVESNHSKLKTDSDHCPKLSTTTRPAALCCEIVHKVYNGTCLCIRSCCTRDLQGSKQKHRQDACHVQRSLHIHMCMLAAAVATLGQLCAAHHQT